MAVKIYAKVGESMVQQGGSLPTGWIEMSSVRPEDGGVWVAGEDGNWIEQISELDKLKIDKMSELDMQASQKINSGFWYQDNTIMEVPLHFSFDTIDQSNFNSAMNGANLYLVSLASGSTEGLIDNIDWNGYTDIEHKNLVELNFNASQFVQFWGYAETMHKNVILQEVRLLKQQVTNASTVEEINNIVWE